MTPFEILGFLLVPGDVVPSLLRLRHLRKTRSVAGVSGATNAQWMVSWWLWAFYAVLIDSIPLLVVSLCVAFVDTVLVVLLMRAGAVSVRTLVFFVIVGILLAALGVIVTPEIIAALLTVIDLVVLLPQVRLAIREADLSGISIPAWGFSLLQDVGWVVYGFGIGHPLLAGWSIASAPASVIILIQAIRRRRQQSRQ